MNSPFPGFDPYLEHPAFWGMFHNRFAHMICDLINEQLPIPYLAVALPEWEEYTVVGVEIRYPETGQPLTHIEILSPAKKEPSNEAYQAYLNKRLAYLENRLNLI